MFDLIYSGLQWIFLPKLPIESKLFNLYEIPNAHCDFYFHHFHCGSVYYLYRWYVLTILIVGHENNLIVIVIKVHEMDRMK